MDVSNLVYRKDLTATFTCNAFGGDGIELEFLWSPDQVNLTSITTSVDPVDNSTTSTIRTNVLTADDRGREFMCQVRYAVPDPNLSGDAMYEQSEIATIPSIGK